MSTTDQPIIDAEASRAARGAWAVPVVDRPAAGSTADQTSAAGDADTDAEAEAPARKSPEAVRQAAVDWQRELHVAATGGPGEHVHPVIAAVAACVTALDAVREAGMGTMSVGELRMLLLAIAHVLAAAVALKLRLLAAADAKKIADLTGATCTAAAWAHLTRGNRPDASGEVRLAKDLDTRYPLLAGQDGICGIPGCDRPITEYHHPFAWSHGGDTSVANYLGLCGYHHRLAHHPKWRVVHLQGKLTFERVKQ